MREGRAILIHHTAHCYTCGWQVCARNAMGVAVQHARKNNHDVDISLGYSCFASKK